MNFFTKAILGSVAVLLAAVAFILIFRSKEAGRVEALVREGVEWAARGEAEKIVGVVDEHYEDGPDFAKEEIRRRIRPGWMEKIEIVDLDVGVSGEDANVKLVLRMQHKDIGMPIPQTFRIALRKREAGWRVISVRNEEIKR